MEKGALAIRSRPAEVSRTLIGLRNLQVFRGDFKLPRIDLHKMMIGPCHFFGTLPTGNEVTSYRLLLPSADLSSSTFLGPRPEYQPIFGPSPAHTQKVLDNQHQLASAKPLPPSSVSLTGNFRGNLQLATTLTPGSNNAGIFVVESCHPSPCLEEGPTERPKQANSTPACAFEVHDASALNLEAFGAQVVKNGEEFAIPGVLSDQDDLQLITYWWGEDYWNHAMEHDDGAFLETHDFAQAVTPLTEDCGGHILLGRPSAKNCNSAKVEVVAVYIPFGYTMIIGKNAWHGDMGLKGLHLMAMTANHIIMEGTTQSWFLKRPGAAEVGNSAGLHDVQNFSYTVKYAGCPLERVDFECATEDKVAMPIPSVLPLLVRATDSIFASEQIGKVRHERWDAFLDEGIRMYAPWSSPSDDMNKKAIFKSVLDDVITSLAPSCSLSRKQNAPESGDDRVYVEHQHDLVHRLNHGAARLYQKRCETVGRVSPLWMLRAPRSGFWRHSIDKVVGVTLAGGTCFEVENVWSDATVGDLLGRIDLEEDQECRIVSPAPHSKVLEMSDFLMDHFPHPLMAEDGASELLVAVVTKKLHLRPIIPEYPRERVAIKFLGITLFMK
eukprot:TRINITY_DN62534_c0_g1_i1.p1 TRINITY_DN62534_c0_g1~~TRINITY_DN62534_c0_g1_i1.p1  ORF type:complete len:691 (-),score=74.37 TRINITY_DN62534_c0_g1_i1:50-1876(-)